MSIFSTTEPEAIRTVLARLLETVLPTYPWEDGSRWTWQKDAEVMGTLRNFDLIFGVEEEVGTPGSYAAYGGGITYRCLVECKVSYPVDAPTLRRLMGGDSRDLSAILERLHESVAGMFAQANSVDRRVVPSFTGSDGAYVGTFAFEVHFFASDQVAVAS